MQAEYGSPREYLLIEAFKRRQNMEFIRAAMSVATVNNPPKAVELLGTLREYMYPEVARVTEDDDSLRQKMIEDEAKYIIRINSKDDGETFGAMREKVG